MNILTVYRLSIVQVAKSRDRIHFGIHSGALIKNRGHYFAWYYTVIKRCRTITKPVAGIIN